jgi:GWxTD domain-containing protein
MIKKILFVLMIGSAVALAATQQITWEDLRKNIDSWINGPVSLIATAQEKDTFKKLKTPEEKMQFIKIFWARRDPILRTYENEYKEEFNQRVDYANEHFAESGTPGWQSARGQVYILFGPPSREDKRTVEESNRPALLWVYDKVKSNAIPRNEALMFVWRDIKYVLVPPNADPGDYFGEQQRQMDSTFRYQTIPGAVEQAFADVRKADIIDESKDYKSLLFSVNSTEKFGIAGINFDIHPSQGGQVEIAIAKDNAPVYDAGNTKFAELYFKLELKQGDHVVATNESTKTFNWNPADFDTLKEISVTLPALKAPAGEYEVSVTVQDRISNVSETRKIAVTL